MYPLELEPLHPSHQNGFPGELHHGCQDSLHFWCYFLNFLPLLFHSPPWLWWSRFSMMVWSTTSPQMTHRQLKKGPLEPKNSSWTIIPLHRSHFTLTSEEISLWDREDLKRNYSLFSFLGPQSCFRPNLAIKWNLFKREGETFAWRAESSYPIHPLPMMKTPGNSVIITTCYEGECGFVDLAERQARQGKRSPAPPENLLRKFYSSLATFNWELWTCNLYVNS